MEDADNILIIGIRDIGVFAATDINQRKTKK